MAAATTAPGMELRALLAAVQEGPDEAAAAAVTAFVGDINACVPGETTVLNIAVRCRPLTLAALAARGDCNPNTVTQDGMPVLCELAAWCSGESVATFLAHFPTLDVHACDLRGYTPLHYAAQWDNKSTAKLLLNAGANPTIHSQEGLAGITPVEVARLWRRKRCTKLLEAATAAWDMAWHNSLRQGWLCAVLVECE